MSAILGRVEESKKRIPAKVLEELGRRKLSQLLRRESWPDHERAEHSPFEVALVMGTVTREAYKDLLANVYPVYCALEERAEELRSDPIGGEVYFPELNRKQALEQDLTFYWGPDWPAEITHLPVTAEYVQRILDADPVQFVAHHYNRYLADLSGGIFICEALKKAWSLDGDGVRYYDFVDIPDAAEFKNGYRAKLDSLPLDTDGKMRLIEEVMVAYEFNIAMVAELADRFGITAETARAGAGPHPHHG